MVFVHLFLVLGSSFKVVTVPQHTYLTRAFFRYLESATTLSKETNLDMSKYDVCDNVDLETVLMEYESYYFVRFQKYPKIIKKLTESGEYCQGYIGGMKN